MTYPEAALLLFLSSLDVPPPPWSLAASELRLPSGKTRLTIRSSGGRGRSLNAPFVASIRRLAGPERFLVGDNNGSFGTLSSSGKWTPVPWLSAALQEPKTSRVEDFDVDPTGRRVAYRESADGTVWCAEPSRPRRVLLAGTQVRRLGGYAPGERRQTYDSRMSWSIDAKRLAFSVPARRMLYEAAGDHDADTFVLNVATGRVRRCGPGVPMGWIDATRVLTYRHKTGVAEVRDATTGHLLRTLRCREAHAGPGIIAVAKFPAGSPIRLEGFTFPGFRSLGTIALDGGSAMGTSVVAVWPG